MGRRERGRGVTSRRIVISEAHLRADIPRFADLGLSMNLSEVDARTNDISGRKQNAGCRAHRVSAARGCVVVEDG